MKSEGCKPGLFNIKLGSRGFTKAWITPDEVYGDFLCLCLFLFRSFAFLKTFPIQLCRRMLYTAVLL